MWCHLYFPCSHWSRGYHDHRTVRLITTLPDYLFPLNRLGDNNLMQGETKRMLFWLLTSEVAIWRTVHWNVQITFRKEKAISSVDGNIRPFDVFYHREFFQIHFGWIHLWKTGKTVKTLRYLFFVPLIGIKCLELTHRILRYVLYAGRDAFRIYFQWVSSTLFRLWDNLFDWKHPAEIFFIC